MRKPIAVYNAGTNLEAHAVKGLLIAAGIEAFAVDDVSLVGFSAFGTLPEIHKPQVWVDEADLERAQAVLQAYQETQSESAHAEAAAPAGPIEVVCEDCGHRTTFPAADRGKTRECPRCRNYVDVEEPQAGEDEYWRGNGDEAD